MIRRLTSDDAEELTRLLVASREPHRLFQPLRSDAFFTVETQRTASPHPTVCTGFSTAKRLPERSRSPTSRAARTRARASATGSSTNVAAAARDPLSHSDCGARFRRATLHRLEAATLVDNVASQRVLEKNRFRHIGLAPRYLQIAGAWRDHLLFQRTVED